MGRLGYIIAAALATLCVLAPVAMAGGNGVGSGGLQGFPPTSVDGTPITPSSIDAGSGIIGGCYMVGGTIYCPVGKFDNVDAGVVQVWGSVQMRAADLPIQWPAGRYSCNATQCYTNNDFGCEGDGTCSMNVSGHLFAAIRSKTTLTFGTSLIGVGLLDSQTAPTVVACSGTAASVTMSNGSASVVFDVGTSCAGESTAVITLPAATNGWLCSCSSTTADRVLQQKVIPPANTTQVTIQNVVMSTGVNGDFTDNADVGCLCRGI